MSPLRDSRVGARSESSCSFSLVNDTMPGPMSVESIAGDLQSVPLTEEAIDQHVHEQRMRETRQHCEDIGNLHSLKNAGKLKFSMGRTPRQASGGAELVRTSM